jgi:hypothetical protein
LSLCHCLGVKCNIPQATFGELAATTPILGLFHSRQSLGCSKCLPTARADKFLFPTQSPTRDFEAMGVVCGSRWQRTPRDTSHDSSSADGKETTQPLLTGLSRATSAALYHLPPPCTTRACTVVPLVYKVYVSCPFSIGKPWTGGLHNQSRASQRTTTPRGHCIRPRSSAHVAAGRGMLSMCLALGPGG